MAKFEGFPPELPRFLKGLARNNKKAWFDEHRVDYDAYFVEPAREFVDAAGAALRKFSKDVEFEARVNRSIMRINRDVRFSKDKTPYEPSLRIIFWEGSGPKESPGFYFRLTGDELHLGAGLYRFSSAQLDRYRAAVVDPKRGKALTAAISKSTSRGSARIGGQHYKRVPRGFDAEHPRAELLKHRGLHVSYSERLPKAMFGKAAVEHCASLFRELWPVQKWLVQNV